MIATQRTSRSGREGFTLVEVLMAMLVMTVGLLGLLRTMQVTYQHTSRNRLREAAVQLADEQLNGWRNQPFQNITANRATLVLRFISGAPKAFVVTRQKWDIGDCKKLAVKVSWAFQNVSTTHEIYTMKSK